MISCPTCNQFYDAIIYPACPFCNNLAVTVQPNQPNVPVPIELQPPKQFQPSFNVVCPHCGTKNPRFHRHCGKCRKPLQTYSHTMEVQTHDSQVVQRLDERSKQYLYLVALREFVMKFLNLSLEKQQCPKCKTICTFMDDDCPNPHCKNPIYRYPCGTQGCGELLHIMDKECPKCHQMTLYQFIEMVLNDEATGDMAKNVFKTAEKLTGFKIYKRTLPSSVDGRFLLQAKNVLETICAEKAKTLETLALALRDVSVTTQPVDLGNTFQEIFTRRNGNGMGDLQNPSPTNNIIDVIQRRAVVNPTTGSSSPPTNPDDTVTVIPRGGTRTPNPPDEEEDSTTPWENDPFSDHDIA